VGPVALLKMKPCRRLYTGNKSDDLALIYATRKATFYAVQAWCPHAGECNLDLGWFWFAIFMFASEFLALCDQFQLGYGYPILPLQFNFL
jgi:hypothetical protein